MAVASANPPRPHWFACGWWLPVVIYGVTALLIVVLAKVCFGSSLDNYLHQPHIHISAGYWRNIYRHGWPWEFRSWAEGGFFVFEEDWSWKPWALMSDVGVFVLTVAVLLWLARRMVRKPRWSLGASLVALTLTCVVVAWAADARRQSVLQRRLCRDFWQADNYLDATYQDPVWFSRLMGQNRAGDELFFRLGDCLTLRPSGSDGVEPLFSLVERHPNVRELELYRHWHDKDVARLWQIESLAELEKLNLSDLDLSDAALNGIERLERLQVVDLRLSTLGDGAIERLANCKSLSTLYLSQSSITPACLPVLDRLADRVEIDASATALPVEAQSRFRKPKHDYQYTLLRRDAFDFADPD